MHTKNSLLVQLIIFRQTVLAISIVEEKKPEITILDATFQHPYKGRLHIETQNVDFFYIGLDPLKIRTF